MARKLELDIGSKSDVSGLVAQAKAVDHLADEADRLQREFKQAERAAAGLDKQLLETKAATAALATEFAKTGDKKIKAELDAQRAAARDLGRLRADIIGDTEKDADRASRVWQKAADQLKRQTEKVTRDQDRDSRLAQRAAAAAANVAAKAGAEGAQTFAAAFEGGLMNALRSLPAPAQAGIAGSLGAAAVLATPVIASAINAAIITGVGAGGLAAGIALAARDESVKSAFAEMGQEALKGLTESASPFVVELRRVAEIFGAGLEEILPDLKGIFGDLATTVQPLARGLVGLAKEALPGIRRAAAAAVPMLELIADELPDIGRAMSAFFDSIAEGAPGAIAFMKVFLDQIEGGIVGLGAWLGEMGKVLGGAAILADALGLADFDPSIVVGKIGEVSNAAGAAGKVAGDAFYGLDQRARDAADTMARLNTEFEKAVDNALGLSNANIAVEQDFDDLAESFKRGTNALDINTQKGRDNQRMINDTIADLERRRQADIAAGGATEEAYRKANEAYAAGKARLEAFLVSMGIAPDKAHALVEQLAGVNAELNKITDRSVTVKVKFVKTGDVSLEGVIATGDPRRNRNAAYATGTDFAKAGLALVGEKGPELVNFRGGESVYTAAETSRMMSSRVANPASWGGAADAGVRTLQPVVLQVGPYQIAKALIEYADTRGITVGRLLGIS